MKKVLSFCVFSVLLAVLCTGVKAQAPSGLQMTPANLPTPIVLNQYDTVYLSPTGCFELLGLNDLDSISIEWAILRNGDTIPRAELERYFNEFKLQTKYLVGQSAVNAWWGDSYVSDYCYDGNGWGSFPGAFTPTYGLDLGQACERDGHFNIQIPRHNNPYEFDFFFVQFFKDTINTGHRVVYNIKEDGDYQFVFQIWKRGCWIDEQHDNIYTCGTSWTNFKMKDENGNVIESGNNIASGVPYIGGHETKRYLLISSDTLHQIKEDSIPDKYLCVGDTLWMGNPAQFYTETGDYTAYYYGTSSCGNAIDSILHFHLQVENPEEPILDTLNSDLIFCDSADLTITAIPQSVSSVTGTCIWYNAEGDSLATGRTYTFHATESTILKVVSYNPESECASPDSLTVYIEKYDSPDPRVTVDTTEQCVDGTFNFTLDRDYDYLVWFHNGDTMTTVTDYQFTIDPATVADAGAYFATVADTNYHTVYPDVVIACPANSDTVNITVYTLPNPTLVSFDGHAYSDTTFCPDRQSHTATYEIADGTAPYTLTWGNNDAAHDDVALTSTIETTMECGKVYADSLLAVIDAHNCEWHGNIPFQFSVNDTIDPVITMRRRDTTALPAYDLEEQCKYLVPDVHSLIESTTDNCTTIDPLTATQTPAAGTLIDDTTMVYLTIVDSCGNTATDSVEVTIDYIPVSFVADTTAQVRCAGECNAEITVTVSNGHAPYDVVVAHNNGNTTVGTTYTLHGNGPAFVFPDLCEGEWTVSVTDSNGCTYPDTILNVSNPDILTLNISDSADLRCHNDHSGSFQFQVAGGRAPLQVTITKDGAAFDSWTANAAFDTLISNLDAGTYAIQVIDDSSCQVQDTVTLTQPDTLLITDVQVDSVSCYGYSDGSATATVTGGTPYVARAANATIFYMYSWVDLSTMTEVSTSQTALNLPAGTYRLYVTDANGCVDSTDVEVFQPDTLEVIEVTALTNSNCPRLASYEFAAATNGGGSPAYIYNWLVNNNAEQTTTDNLDTTSTYSHVPTNISCDTTLNILFEVYDSHRCYASGNLTFRIYDDQHPVVEGALRDTTMDGCDSNAVFAPATDVAGLEAMGLEISDNCTADADIVVTTTDNANGTSCPVVIVRTYTVTDQCGLDTSFSYNITIQDTMRPTFDTPDDITIYKDSSCLFDADPEFTGMASNLNDNCTSPNILPDNMTFVDDTLPGHCEGEIIITRTWTLTDECGNQSLPGVQRITIADNIAPWFTNLRGYDTVACNGSGNTMALDMFLNSARAADNCAFDELTNERVDSVPGCNKSDYTLIYRFTASDKCGNTTDTLAYFVVIDTVKPTFAPSAPDILAECDTITSVDAIIAAWSSRVDYTDGCVGHDNVTMRDSLAFEPACGNTGVYTKFWFLSDGCNTNADSATFTIRDIGQPNIYPIPADTTVDCDGEGNQADFLTWLMGPQASDNCGDATMRYYYRLLSTGDLKYEFDPQNIPWNSEGYFADALQNDTVPCAVFYEILWEAEDECGNIRTTRERFTIKDMSGPEIFNLPNDTAIQCGNDEEIYEALENWLSQVYAVDKCGNDTLHVQTLRSQTIYRPMLTHNWTSANAIVDCGPTARHWDVQWIATDGDCENETRSEMRTFSIIDTLKPVVVNMQGGNTVLADTFYIDRTCDIPELFPNAYNINDVINNHMAGIREFIDCSLTDNSMVYHYPMEGLYSDNGCSVIYNAYYELEDECGNVLRMPTFTVFIDTLPPFYANNLRDTIYLTAECEKPAVEPFTAVSQMNAHASEPNITDCNFDDAGVELNADPDTTELNCGFSVVRTYTLTDACGNDTTITHTIIILDNLNPVISGIAPYDTVYSNTDCEVPAADTAQLYADLVDQNALEDLYPEFGIFDCSAYTITRGASVTTEGVCPEKTIVTTFTVTDACDNSSTFEHTLYIVDTIRPVLPVEVELRQDTVMLTEDCLFTLPTEAFLTTYGDLQNWDAEYEIEDCHVHAQSFIELKRIDTADMDCFFDVTFTYTVFDDCANESDPFYLTIVVKDTIAPKLSDRLIGPDTLFVDPEDCTTDDVEYITTPNELATVANITVTDCNIDMDNDMVALVAEDTVNLGEMNCHRVVYRKYVVSDNCDNPSDTITHEIHLIDNVGPDVQGEGPETHILLDPVTCTSPVVDTIRTLQELAALLGFGQSSQQTPIHTNITLEINDCNINPSCVVELISVDSSEARCPRVVTRTYKVYDACGNISENSFDHVIYIEDQAEPTITGAMPDSIIYMTDYPDCELPAVEPYTSVTQLPDDIDIFDCNLDNALTLVSSDTVYQASIADYLPNVISITRTYQVGDSCGNNTTFTHIIYVRDTFPPVVNTDYTFNDFGQEFPMVKDTIVYMSNVRMCRIPEVPEITWDNYMEFPGMNSITDCQLVEEIILDSVTDFYHAIDGDNFPDCVDTMAVYYSVRDSSQNVAVFVQRIIVMDTLHPVVEGGLFDLYVYTDENCDFTTSLNELTVYTTDDILDYGGDFSIEDCHDWSVTHVEDGDAVRDGQNCDNNYLIRYYTISDVCGNDTIIEQRINIRDTIAPVVEAIPDQPADASTDCKFYVPDLRDLVSAAFSDNCSSDTMTFVQNPAQGTELHQLRTDVQVIVTDSCANADTITVTVYTPDTLKITATSTDMVSCHGMSDGVIYITAEGGTPDYVLSTNGNDYTYNTIPGLAAGIYTVVVTDQNNCTATAEVEVTEPDTLDVELTTRKLDDVSYTEFCQGDPIDVVAIIPAATPGTPGYTYTFEFATQTDTVVRFNNTTNDTEVRDTISDLDTAGAFASIITIVDSRGCVASDTVNFTIYPTYYFFDSVRVCVDSNYKWVGHFRNGIHGADNDTIYATEMSTPNRAYHFFDSLTTVNGCDSVYELKIMYSSLPYLTIRYIGEDESALAEHDLDTTWANQPYIAGAGVNHVAPGEANFPFYNQENTGYEIFVQRNCTQCSEDLKVSIDYDIYMYENDQWQLISNDVTDYFTSYASAYWDRFIVGEIELNNAQFSTPEIYRPRSQGSTNYNFDYYNLCWLAPEYVDIITATPQNSWGTFYPYGRAHVIDFSEFTTAGRYKIVAKLQERSAPFSPWNWAGYGPYDGQVGGHNSTIAPDDTIYSGITMYFTITDEVAAARQNAPIVDPFNGIVVKPVTQDVVPSAMVYPNPAQDYVMIELSGFEGLTSVQLSSSNAKVLSTETIDIPDTSSTQIVKINTADYAPGVYMVTARNNDVIVTKRVVIVR